MEYDILKFSDDDPELMAKFLDYFVGKWLPDHGYKMNISEDDMQPHFPAAFNDFMNQRDEGTTG